MGIDSDNGSEFINRRPSCRPRLRHTFCGLWRSIVMTSRGTSYVLRPMALDHDDVPRPRGGASTTRSPSPGPAPTTATTPPRRPTSSFTTTTPWTRSTPNYWPNASRPPTPPNSDARSSTCKKPCSPWSPTRTPPAEADKTPPTSRGQNSISQRLNPRGHLHVSHQDPAPLLGADGAQDVEPGGPAGQEHGRTIKRNDWRQAMPSGSVLT